MQVVPRIDWAKIAAQTDPSSTRKKTRKVRPPQRLFTEQLVQDAGGFDEVDEYENVTRFNNKVCYIPLHPRLSRTSYEYQSALYQ